ncbi:MAG: FISUMP domain-containing protein [Bacteroidales bacterium]
MKKLLLTIINLMLIITVIAQAPQGISHQAVIRDANNQLVINTQVGVKISILRYNIEGYIVYSETHTPVSNANGLISFVIGRGTVVSGVFADIDWTNGPYFIKIEVDPAGGTNYTITGTSQILSVPYAFHSSSLTLTSEDGTKYRISVDNDGNIFTTNITTHLCGTPFTDSRDDQSYNTVLIGNQCWMAENLKYLPGVIDPDTGSEITPYYYVYGYDGTDVDEAKATDEYHTYGALYNWPAAMAGGASSIANPSGVQGVCPMGWHLPSDAEWTQLTDYLGGEDVAGGKLKEAGTEHWAAPNEGATNETGFTALPGGGRFSDGTFDSSGYFGNWWSATEDDTDYAWGWYMSYDNGGVYRNWYSKELGLSVRCVRD